MDMLFKEFKTELLKHNNYLWYFPVPDNRQLAENWPDDVKIIDGAKRIEWQRDVFTANIDPYGMKLYEYYKYLEKLKIKHRMDNLTHKLKEVKNADHKKKRKLSLAIKS